MFRNHYDCPCGNSWTDEHDCTVDDKCSACGLTCSPSSSEDVETGPIVWIAPDGTAIAGVAQVDQASWPVVWDDPADAGSIADYVESAGPDSDCTDRDQIDGNLVFVDENGTEWLARHLIREGQPALPAGVLGAIRADFAAAEQWEMAKAMLRKMDGETAALLSVPEMVDALGERVGYRRGIARRAMEGQG